MHPQDARWIGLGLVLTLALICAEAAAAVTVARHQHRFTMDCRAQGGEAFFFGHVWDMTCVHFS